MIHAGELDPLVIASFYIQSPVLKHKMEEHEKQIRRFVGLEWVFLITLNIIWTVGWKPKELNDETLRLTIELNLRKLMTICLFRKKGKRKGKRRTAIIKKLSRRFATAWLTHLWRKCSLLNQIALSDSSCVSYTQETFSVLRHKKRNEEKIY